MTILWSNLSIKMIFERKDRVVAGRQETGGADRAGHEAVLAGRLARDLRRLLVDLERVLLEPPLGQLQPGGLERVGLEHLGARLDHRREDALDHVGAVEDERLVAAPGQPVLVLESQVELLERGAHAAVVEDAPFAHRGQVIAQRHDASNVW